MEVFGLDDLPVVFAAAGAEIRGKDAPEALEDTEMFEVSPVRESQQLGAYLEGLAELSQADG